MGNRQLKLSVRQHVNIGLCALDGFHLLIIEPGESLLDGIIVQQEVNLL